MRKKTPKKVVRKAPPRTDTSTERIAALEEQISNLSKAHEKLLGEKYIRDRVERETEHVVKQYKDADYRCRRAEEHAKAMDAEVLRLKRTVNNWIDRCRILSGTQEGEHEMIAMVARKEVTW